MSIPFHHEQLQRDHDNVEPQLTDVATSHFLPSWLLSGIRLGMGICLLVTGYQTITLSHAYQWYAFATPLCGISFILLSICAALQSKNIHISVYISESVTVLYIVSAALSIASLSEPVEYLQLRAIAAVLIDFGVGARLRFRPLHIFCPVVVLLPQLLHLPIIDALGDAVVILAASALMFALSHIPDIMVLDKEVAVESNSALTLYQSIY